MLTLCRDRPTNWPNRLLRGPFFGRDPFWQAEFWTYIGNSRLRRENIPPRGILWVPKNADWPNEGVLERHTEKRTVLSLVEGSKKILSKKKATDTFMIFTILNSNIQYKDHHHHHHGVWLSVSLLCEFTDPSYSMCPLTLSSSSPPPSTSSS